MKLNADNQFPEVHDEDESVRSLLKIIEVMGGSIAHVSKLPDERGPSYGYSLVYQITGFKCFDERPSLRMDEGSKVFHHTPFSITNRLWELLKHRIKAMPFEDIVEMLEFVRDCNLEELLYDGARERDSFLLDAAIVALSNGYDATDFFPDLKRYRRMSLQR